MPTRDIGSSNGPLARRHFAFLFRGDRQVAFVAIELEGLKLTCRHRTVGLATGGDRSNVRGARRRSIRCEPHIHRLAVPTFTEETILLDREDFVQRPSSVQLGNVHEVVLFSCDE